MQPDPDAAHEALSRRAVQHRASPRRRDRRRSRRDCCRISSGVPSAILLAEIEHGDALRDLHDQAHVVLDQQHGDAGLH